MPEVSISEHARKTRHPGRLFLVTAPSGAGKSSLVNALLARQPNIKLSISNTTRDPRPGEVNGREYHFVTEDMFLEMKSRGEFLESAYVHGHYYGTSRPWIESQMARGNDVLLEIDWQGARQVREKFEGTVGIFILPPSMEELERRLRGRGTETEDSIQERLATARQELAEQDKFTVKLVNNQIEPCAAELYQVICQRAGLQG